MDRNKVGAKQCIEIIEGQPMTRFAHIDARRRMAVYQVDSGEWRPPSGQFFTAGAQRVDSG